MINSIHSETRTYRNCKINIRAVYDDGLFHADGSIIINYPNCVDAHTLTGDIFKTNFEDAVEDVYKKAVSIIDSIFINAKG
ncbi:MAG: hypothetical protein U1E78_02785 [Gammaproteobacteria bacterium]